MPKVTNIFIALVFIVCIATILQPTENQVIKRKQQENLKRSKKDKSLNKIWLISSYMKIDVSDALSIILSRIPADAILIVTDAWDYFDYKLTLQYQ